MLEIKQACSDAKLFRALFCCRCRQAASSETEAFSMYNTHSKYLNSCFTAMECAGDDIDTLCVGPAWCSREHHFFGQEAYCLEAMLRRSNWVSKVQAVPEAFVPVLKLEIRGIDIDLPYAQLPMNELPMEIDLQDNNLLRDMDPTSVTSINGCRVTDKLVQLNTVNGEYRQAFQDALRFLKVCCAHQLIVH